jgi:hypothetical protein
MATTMLQTTCVSSSLHVGGAVVMLNWKRPAFTSCLWACVIFLCVQLGEVAVTIKFKVLVQKYLLVSALL